MIRGLEYLPHKERLEGVMSLILGERNGDLIVLKVFQHLKDYNEKDRGFPSIRSCMEKQFLVKGKRQQAQIVLREVSS